MILYYYQGEKHKGLDGERLINQALNDYLGAVNPQLSENHWQENPTDAVIVRENKGKPYFKDYSTAFSVSHTRDLWVCLMADHPVGVDVQQIKSVKYDSVAKRFFTKLEQDYIHQFGEAGFFEVWCRKEAFVKYTGQGFAGQGFATFSVVDEHLNLTEHIDGIWTHSLELSTEPFVSTPITGALCSQRKEELWIRKL